MTKKCCKLNVLHSSLIKCNLSTISTAPCLHPWIGSIGYSKSSALCIIISRPWQLMLFSMLMHWGCLGCNVAFGNWDWGCGWGCEIVTLTLIGSVSEKSSSCCWSWMEVVRGGSKVQAVCEHCNLQDNNYNRLNRFPFKQNSK